MRKLRGKGETIKAVHNYLNPTSFLEKVEDPKNARHSFVAADVILDMN